VIKVTLGKLLNQVAQDKNPKVLRCHSLLLDGSQ